MSGIVAIVNFDGEPVDPQILKKMAEQCAYRGPDGIRYWIYGNVGLAHLALHATQEALRERMPMTSADGSLCLTADARIDNRPELIELLKAKGTPFPAEPTDADLILAAYQAFGEACPQHLIGDYAFAIWDANKQHLFCARDALGLKVLHYARSGNILCVASEAQQIIQHPVFPPRLDEMAVADHLVDNLWDETRSMFQDVHKLAPGHLFNANPSGQEPKRYWDIDPNFQTVHNSDEEYAAHFLEIFTRAVSDRLRTPQGTGIGITMSGGMDSTSVAAVAQHIINHQSGKPPLLACSYAFETLKECDESQYSQAVADQCGIELIYVPAENFWFLDNDENYTPSLESPFLSAEESVLKFILGLFAERNVRVWLSGHGGDSLVGGSSLIYADRFRQGDWTVFKEIAQLLRKNQRPFLRILKAYQNWIIKPLTPEGILKLHKKLRGRPSYSWLDAGFVQRTRINERIPAPPVPRQFSDFARQDNYQSVIMMGAVGRAIRLTEWRATQIHQEARHPILDRRLAEFVFSIPADQTFRNGWRKFILRKALHGILPKTVLNRPGKTRFNTYFTLGIRERENFKIANLLRSPLLSRLNLVYLDKLLNIHGKALSEKDGRQSNIMIKSITLELWLRKYFGLFVKEGEHENKTG